jgi:hypothetical protein
VTEESSGHPQVDAALHRLAEAEGKSPSEQLAIYEDVHRTLQDALADAGDDESG